MDLWLKRRFPTAWVDELLAEVERQALPCRATGEGAALELCISADDEDVPAFTAWLAEHGDAEPALIFGARRHQFDPPKQEIRLFPGESDVRPAGQWSTELVGMELDLGSLALSGGEVTIDGTVQRLIPRSGFLGRMGLYPVRLSFSAVSGVETEGEGSLIVSHLHHDPACSRLTIGSPLHGEIILTTDSGQTTAELGGQPVAVRRWRRFLPA